MTTAHDLDPTTMANIDSWLNGHYDDNTKKEVLKLIKENPKEAADAFYTTLSFGTAGMRGIMGVGSSRINNYTIRAATQGLANYVNKQPVPQGGHSAFIGFDSRHHSKTFAEEAAKVLAANGIKVYLCQDLRPTPLVSFGCRLKKCTTAIMITASHNPPQYNGYKVYWSDGGQVLPPHDTGIMEEVSKITDPAMVKTISTLHHPLITLVSEEIDAPYIDEGRRLQYYSEEDRRYNQDLKIVYTSLHGTGITLAPKMLAAWGFTNVSFVDKQIIPDGDFPTATYPNPEEKAALALGIEKLEAIQGDILIATDPDADRVGVAVLHQGKVTIFNGNQIASLCLEHVCESLTEADKMPKKAAFIKTIMTTEMFKAICDAYQKPCINVLTGFKYIAEKIFEWEKDPEGYQYVFGGEESYGYLFGTLTRDKDAIITSALICQMALHLKKQGKTLVDFLYDLYRKYGVFVESLLSVGFEESKEGKEKMTQSMASLRQHLPDKINGIEIEVVEDYLSSSRTHLKSQKKENILLPKSDILLLWLVDGTKLIIRPSGTEPKIKLYCGVVNKGHTTIEERLKHAQIQATQLLASVKQLLTKSI